MVILLGPPGAGKGTQAQRIAGQFGLQHLSTGDMLRDNIRRNTELANKAKPIIERGELVPDQIILGMVQDCIAQSNCGNGFILDGFPRTLPQARGLEGIIRYYKSRSTTVVNIAVQPEFLIRRLTNRRICKMHGHIYSLVDRPPIHEGICDVDGSELIQRPDDNEAVIRERIHTYECHTRPLIDYYSARGLLREVQGVGEPDAVMANIMKILDKDAPAK
ncbi:MAG: adenylate kinase [Acidobacteriia bacterium]|nr:adenylate kinase [Terriglobia bacterium]